MVAYVLAQEPKALRYKFNPKRFSNLAVKLNVTETEQIYFRIYNTSMDIKSNNFGSATSLVMCLFSN